MSHTPVILLTGFLGSGKTTLLSQLLRQPQFSDTAVIINEFGEIGLDHVLIENAPEQIVEMTSGCLCCTVRGDIRNTLMMLHAKREQGEIPYFQRIVIETTGLADPVPVIQTLRADPRLLKRFKLAKVITCVDAVNGIATLNNHAEAIKQINIADSVVISKTDLVTDTPDISLAILKTRLGELNPGAECFIGYSSQSLGSIFSHQHLDSEHSQFNAEQWLNAEAFHAHEKHSHHEHEHEHEHEHGNVNRHSDRIHAYCITLEKPMKKLTLESALELLASNSGEQLLRVKGIVEVQEYPGKPFVIHAVQHVLHPPVQLQHWPAENNGKTGHKSQLVFITDGIEKTMLDEFFKVWSSFGND